MREIAVGQQPEPPPDDAAAAFEAMRRQLALLTSAVEGFAARQEAIAARDYAPDLARLIKAQGQVHEAINELNRRPGVSLTPKDIAEQIDAAAVTNRLADHTALVEAAHGQAEAARRLDAMIGRLRTDQQQRDALAWAWLAGMVTVMVLVILAQVVGMRVG
ncbi:hypothetical protein RCO27_11820 [Sphingosinicella sp. LHD-64]|uniref:hypothetical protein n=1 Tax=Sphingosinicella sp. LHD-64 TaxID=3072139 RepID=UPI002810024E|nr:hypothetical protein [Sphingosinicella sp. LHD-64]MDQ8756914.1 hypothetical protein [Sphingosinicella sp. LHD-64]